MTAIYYKLIIITYDAIKIDTNAETNKKVKNKFFKCPGSKHERDRLLDKHEFFFKPI